MFKILMSFKVLGFILASSPVFSFDLELPEERKVARINCAANTEPQQIFMCEDKAFLKGEVRGDGNCALTTLQILFPHKNINRDEFAKRLRVAVNMPGQKSEQFREDLAHSLFMFLFADNTMHGITPTNEYKGKFIAEINKNIKSKKFDIYDYQSSIDTIIKNDNVIEDVVNSLAQDGVTLSLPDVPERRGSFELVCELFGLNLDVFTNLRGKDLLSIRKIYTSEEIRECRYRFDEDKNAPIQSALFNIAGHCSPLCDIRDIPLRIKLANFILQMVKDGVKPYNELNSDLREQLLENSHNQPAQAVENIDPSNQFIIDDTDIAFNKLMEVFRDIIRTAGGQKDQQILLVKEIESQADSTVARQKENYLLALALVKNEFGLE